MADPIRAHLKPDTCKKCSAEIYWVQMLKSGRPMILDRKRLAVVVVDKTTGKGRLVHGYEPHWGSCPFAEEFKRPKKGGD